MLSDILKPRICELGKIKIGGLGEERNKRDNSGTYRLPVKLDHFIVTTMNRDARGDLVPDQELMKDLAEQGFADKKDGKLRELPIQVLSDDVEEIMQCEYRCYQGKRLAAKSDGKTLTKHLDGGKWLDKPIEVPWTPEAAAMTDGNGNRVFKKQTTLNCIIESVHSRWGGVYKFRTTSGISGDQLFGSLCQVRDLTPGRILAGLPLSLVVRPIQVAPDGKPTTVYVVHVELRGSDLQAIQSRALELARNKVAFAQQFKRAAIEYRKIISTPEDAIDAADIASEFYPEPSSDDKPASGPDPLARDIGITGDAETNAVASETTAANPETTAQESETADAPAEQPPARPPLSEARQREIMTELHRLGSVWHEEKTKKRVSEIIGRELGPDDHIGSLTEEEATALLAKLVHAAPPKPKKAAKPAAA